MWIVCPSCYQGGGGAWKCKRVHSEESGTVGWKEVCVVCWRKPIIQLRLGGDQRFQ